MKVLVTGAAGFIGSNLMHHLADKRPTWKLCALDSLTYAGNLKNIATLLEHHKATFSKCDITDIEALTMVFEQEKPDMVFHLAAESHVDRSIHDPAAFIMTNVVGTQNLITIARHSEVRRFVHVSTDEVYGSLGPTGRFVESTPLDPTSPYAASKAASDLLVLAAVKTHQFNAVVTRCTNNYGPYQFPEKLIPLFITNAVEDKPLPMYGDGMQVRNWIYVRDHCEAVLIVAEQGAVGEVYNIGGGEASEITNRDVTYKILHALNKPETLIKRVEDRLAHDRRYAIDHHKMHTAFGWEPSVNFDQGLANTIAWYLANELWWREVKSGAYREYYSQMYTHRLAGAV